MTKISETSYKNITFCVKCGNRLILKTDRENKLRPICENCGWVYYKNPIPAVACVVFNEKKELLIIKRKQEPKSGEWALPSGYMEIYQNPQETAIDEMKEETGLIGEVDKFLDFYFGYSPIYERVISFGFLMRVTGGELRAGDDAAEACFVPLDKLPEIAFLAHKHYIKIAKKILHENDRTLKKT